MGAKQKLEMHKKKKMAKGGVNEYNAQGSPEVKEAKDQKEGFHKGGPKKDGGKADGKKAKHRMDKMARGGVKKMAAGGPPFTAAKKRTPYLNVGAGEGHDSDGGKGRDPEAD